MVKAATTRDELVLGLRYYSRQDLEGVQARSETLQIRVLGLATIASDVSAELARNTIAGIRVLGVLQASPTVRAALADRIL